MQASHALSVVGRRIVADVLLAGAERTPDRPMLIFDDLAGTVRTFTWSEVLARSLATARALAAAGIGRGDRLHLHLPNRPEFLFWWFGAPLRAAVIVPTNTASAPAELQYILGHVGACASVTDHDRLSAVRQARVAAALAGPVWTCDAAPVDGSGDGAVITADPLDDLAVMYTSGTTSRPKGVRVTHANYVFAGESVAAGLALTPEDRFLVVLPLFHANAQYYSVMSTLVTGGTVVLPGSCRDRGDARRRLAAHRRPRPRGPRRADHVRDAGQGHDQARRGEHRGRRDRGRAARTSRRDRRRGDRRARRDA